MLPIFDLNTETGRTDFSRVLDRLRGTASPRGDAAETVTEIMKTVRVRRDAGLVSMMREYADPDFGASRIQVADEELDAALAALDPDLKASILRAIENVTAYQKHVMPNDPGAVKVDGAELGMRWTPVDRVGLYVPGGTAELFSTLVMLAVPALVAGVKPENLSVACPPPTRTEKDADGNLPPVKDVAQTVLATARLLGVGKVYRLGGAQAIAAMAHGTDRVDKVDIVAGPGNVYVQLAKAQLGGVCGTDNGFYGPSEIVTVADDTANSAWVAADLIAQAEHNPGKCFLVAWQPEVVDAVLVELDQQLKNRGRGDAILAAFKNESCVVLVPDQDEAVAVANDIACEHVNLAVAKPAAMFKRIRHAGEVFLGDQTPVAAGDYHAGPSHCLPTGTTARFTSGVSVYTFLKRTSTVTYPKGMKKQTIEDIARMAEAEGLDGHAASARIRG
ncbi:MAG: histidinol dehydrogenase [Algisphaera sp.]